MGRGRRRPGRGQGIRRGRGTLQYLIPAASTKKARRRQAWKSLPPLAQLLQRRRSRRSRHAQPCPEPGDVEKQPPAALDRLPRAGGSPVRSLSRGGLGPLGLQTMLRGPCCRRGRPGGDSRAAAAEKRWRFTGSGAAGCQATVLVADSRPAASVGGQTRERPAVVGKSATSQPRRRPFDE